MFLRSVIVVAVAIARLAWRGCTHQGLTVHVYDEAVRMLHAHLLTALSALPFSCSAGEAAEALLQQIAPGNGASSLADVFAASPTVEAGGDVIALLGRQQQWLAGGAVSCYLLLRTRPACLLTATQVHRPSGC